MPAISIDLEDTAGTRQGTGPIVSATAYKTVQRLSKAGTVTFALPCADPKAAGVLAKRVVRGHTLRNGATVALPAGIVDSITVRGVGATPPLLTIAGDDILSELANRRVLSLNLSTGAGGPVPLATALAAIMALAPPGWTLDAATYTASGATVYHQFGNETVLAALIWVANALGEQFRLGSGKQIVWLYHDQPTSGLRAVQTGDGVALAGNSSVLLIESLEEVSDTHTVVTRIYPYGAGNAQARVTLARATWAPPAGYTIDTTNNCIRYDAADAANRIEDIVTYRTIAEIGTTPTDQVSASNQLAVAAYQELRRRIVPVQTYRLTVTKLDAEVRVGETMNVTYRKTIDGYVAVTINADLVVLEVATSYDASGIPSATLTVATVDLAPVTGAAGVLQGLASGEQAASGDIQKATRSLNADAATVAATVSDPNVPLLTAGNVYTVLQSIRVDDAAATAASTVLALRHTTSGTAGPGIGTGMIYEAEVDSGGVSTMGNIVMLWADATVATRKARARILVNDNVTSREVLRGETNGSVPMIGVLGANAAARIVVTGSRGGNAALASLLTALATFGWITDSTTV